ncbi:MAG: hypothetical protein RLZZ126_1016 [Pseudomonadota bacterium]|jgi:uncharacterized protein (DUF1800 family)
MHVPKPLLLRLTCVLSLAQAAWLPVHAGPLPDTSAQAAWRAQSRLGYGPGPSAPTTLPSARAWASRHLDAAVQASQQPPRVPAELSTLQLDMPALAREVFQEREAQRSNRAARATAPVVNVMAGMAANPTPTGNLDRFSRDATRDALAWRLQACSDPQFEHPLLAKMTEFWFNHLNVFVGKGSVRPFVGHYVHTLRRHAFGKFEDLLLASATHPAMLQYLDQAQSTVRGLNENYARELMELHTLGVNGGYTQADVRELARILTGWSIALNEGEGFRFRIAAHEGSVRRVMGQEFSQYGQAQGVAAIRFLARHPATAQRIATRLTSFFVSDQPPPALVERLAQTFSATQGDIRAVMQTLIDSPEFWDADHVLFKTPLDFTCSALAATGGVRSPEDARTALGFLSGTGQAMHGWQTPDGYKTDAATWLAPEALTRRADFASSLARQSAEPAFLSAYATATSRERIGREPDPRLRTVLWLAGPDFMLK